MSSPALVSCLGVSGWGPLHWWQSGDGEPRALLARLRLAWRLAQAGGASDPRAPLLLASLLRSSSDLRPLTEVLPPSPLVPMFRHRLVCRPGQRWLHLRSWEWECRSAAVRWRCCGPERRLDAALLSWSRAAAGTALSPPSSAPPLSPPLADAEALHRRIRGTARPAVALTDVGWL